MQKYTKEELLSGGWNEEQINSAIANGDIEIVPIEKNKELSSETIFVENKNSGILVPTEETTIENCVSYITINLKLERPSITIEYIIDSTNQKGKIIASNYEIRLLQGRTYFVPVDCDLNINSDDFIIKEFSDIASLINVRYIKDGKACIIPIRHNITLNNEQRLCILHQIPKVRV